MNCFMPAFLINLLNSKDAEVIARQHSADTDLWKNKSIEFSFYWVSQ